MAQDYAASISGSVIRVTRLEANGNLATGASASYIAKSVISLSMTPEYEDGDEFVQKNAAGEVCVTFKSPDTLKRVALEIAICNPDPEFTEIISGGSLLTTGGQSVGWAAPLVGTDALPNGVAIEIWSKAVVDGRQAGTNPYWHWVFPYAVLRQGGDRTIENDILATSFEGWSLGNAGFGDGPAAPVWPFMSDRAYAYARTASIPTGLGFQPVVADV
jgi:hypothetical protein